MELLADLSLTEGYERLSINQKMQVLAETFCSDMWRLGHKILPYRGKSLERFCLLTEMQKQKAYETFFLYYKICSSGIKENILPGEDAKLLWWAIRLLKL